MIIRAVFDLKDDENSRASLPMRLAMDGLPIC